MTTRVTVLLSGRCCIILPQLSPVFELSAHGRKQFIEPPQLFQIGELLFVHHHQVVTPILHGLSTDVCWSPVEEALVANSHWLYSRSQHCPQDRSSPHSDLVQIPFGRAMDRRNHVWEVFTCFYASTAAQRAPQQYPNGPSLPEIGMFAPFQVHQQICPKKILKIRTVHRGISYIFGLNFLVDTPEKCYW